MSEPQHVDVDPEAYESSEGDSTYGSSLNSYTTSLQEQSYKMLHDRRYNESSENYIFPVDEKESDRLDIVHEMIRVALDGKLYSAPIKNPGRVLDMGTGTGVWAIDFAEEFPEAEVLGNDLHPIQPRWVPKNVHFEQDNIELDWTYSRKFSFIHSRALYGAIKDWPALIRKSFEYTLPGGYVEYTDWDLHLVSPDNSLPEDSPTLLFNKEVRAALGEGIGNEPNPGLYFEQWLKDAGFVDIQVKKIPLPLGTWAKDKKMKEIGAWNYLQLIENIDGIGLMALVGLRGYSKEESDVLGAKMRDELKNRKVHSMLTLYNVVGKKPE